MREGDSQLAEFVLAQIEWELEGISRKQHELARRKTLLRERATRLRLGASPAELDLTVRQHVPAARRLPFSNHLRPATQRT